MQPVPVTPCREEATARVDVLRGSFKAKAPLDLGRHAPACLLGSLLVVWPNRRTEKYGARCPQFFRTLVLLSGTSGSRCRAAGGSRLSGRGPKNF